MDLTPQEIVAELDRYIIGQDEAKRAVAIALRNRYRRRQLAPDVREDILPKNILMIGPTGVGKQKSRGGWPAWRALLCESGGHQVHRSGLCGPRRGIHYPGTGGCGHPHGQGKRMAEVQDRAEALVEDRLVELLVPSPRPPPSSIPWTSSGALPARPKPLSSLRKRRRKSKRSASGAAAAPHGELEDRLVEVVVEKSPNFFWEMPGSGLDDLGPGLRRCWAICSQKRQKRTMTVREARGVLLQEEATKLLDMDAVMAEAVALAEESGIVFIDEIDKIAGANEKSGPDVSREGVQRDILPIIEGSTVITKAGPVRTDYILFIAAGLSISPSRRT